jgi:hypothetical protein
MNRNAFITSVILLLFCLHSGGQQQEGSVFEKRISIQAENQPLHSIIDQISWLSRVYFSYNASIVESDTFVSIDAVDKSLFSILNQLFDPQEFILTEYENQIIIVKKGMTEQENFLTVTDSIPVKLFYLSGKVLERRKENPIPYATVSLVNKPVGTITNSDGEFLLKLHPKYLNDTIIISSMGYARLKMLAVELLDEDLIFMEPVSIRIKEVKVTATTPEKLLENIRLNLENNYTPQGKFMSAFYRETVKQDEQYINVSEAVIEILKAPYHNNYRNDLVRLERGRQSPEVQPFKWLNLKLQGGPFTITQLDVIKSQENFLLKEYEHMYRYIIKDVIWYNELPVYVLLFEPISGLNFYGFVGEIFVHRETFAIVYARYGLNRSGLKKATPVLVKRKPPGVNARPSFVEYQVSYQHYQGTWQLATAQASIKFKIRNRRNNINSEFHSLSELLVTDIQPTEQKRFRREESFTNRDIFVELIGAYDAEFWENFNIIKPDEDLRNAIQNLSINPF